MNVFLATCAASYRQRRAHLRYSDDDCAHPLRCSERCAAVLPVVWSKPPRTASAGHCQLYFPPCCASQPWGCDGIVFVATSLQGRCVPAFSRGAPRRRPVESFQGETCFRGRRLLFHQHDVCAGRTLDEITRYAAFSSRGPRPLLCSCRSHEHAFSRRHALAGGGVRPACTATSRATVRPKSCAQYVDCDPSTPQPFWQ